MAEKQGSVMKIMDGNEAAAYVAYRVTEVSAIYPITPSTTMGELADQWSTQGVKNIWGTVPQVLEMQSEGGAAGVLHGALQTGALATTFTASQGLLLMIPNMFKIAGELNSVVIHVAARALACQGLSIFGDHSDVMSVRETGFALLASGSVQEAHDFALIAHAATLKARVPFVHFFDGFRVSHEFNKINCLSDEQIRAMIDEELVLAHRSRALSPEHPVIRGTAQNPDIYFQAREAVNPYYAKVPGIVEEYLERFEKISGRRYHIMEYYGASDAERIVVMIGSGSYAVKQAVDKLQAAGEKIGLVTIHLYRPFDVDFFIHLLPKTVKKIAILDRVKEPGSLGEPLYQDVVTALNEAHSAGKLTFGMPQIIGGRYGLSSKEFTPAMAKGIFDHLNEIHPKAHFTVGINDDVSDTSISYDPRFTVRRFEEKNFVFYGLGSDGTVGANKNTIKIIGNGTSLFVQGYFVYDSRKAGAKTTSHLRFSKEPICAPYLIDEADFVGCHQFGFVESEQMLANLKKGGIVLLNSPYGKNEVWDHLPRVFEERLLAKNAKFYVIDAYKVARATGMGARINTIMQTCFFAISGILPRDEAIDKIKESIVKTYKRKGEEVIQRNFAAVDQTLANLFEVTLPTAVSAKAHELAPIVSAKAPEFVQKLTATIMAEKGESLPVSALPVDGTYPTATTKWEKRNIAQQVAEWDPELCLQCGQCTMICPHGVLRAKHLTAEEAAKAPVSFKTVPCKAKEFAGDVFHLQVYVEDCTGCGLCHKFCPAIKKDETGKKAIMITDKAPRLETERANIAFFESLPYADKATLTGALPRNMQYLMPYFEFSSACAGCGETSYIKLVSQLFGDRMVVANATGCSSIYGGNLPTTPWTCDSEGYGPAWSNSLFEDNAEFGCGYRLSEDKQRELALEMLDGLARELNSTLVDELRVNVNADDPAAYRAQRKRIAELRKELATLNDPRAKHLSLLAEHLVKRSVWIIGGDGWAYDIGYGGLDHVLASDRNVNVLVLDTEVYSNTGGQASKSTPRAAVAKFATSGKSTARKDLGIIAMTYAGVYVAQISIAANPIQAIKAMQEAERFNGPSLVIAYSHCVAHGYNLSSGIEQQRLAVSCGFWPLYRRNPDLAREGKNPFILDSKTSTVAVKDYIYNEPRFKSLLAQQPERAAELLKELEGDVKRRLNYLTKLAEI